MCLIDLSCQYIRWTCSSSDKSSLEKFLVLHLRSPPHGSNIPSTLHPRHLSLLSRYCNPVSLIFFISESLPSPNYSLTSPIRCADVLNALLPSISGHIHNFSPPAALIAWFVAPTPISIDNLHSPALETHQNHTASH